MKIDLTEPVEVGKRREPHISEKISQAKKSGYNDEQILNFLSQKDPRVSQALEQGHSPKDVISFLSKQKAFGNEGWLAGGMFGRGVESTLQDPLLPIKEAAVAAVQGLEKLGEAFNPRVRVPQHPLETPREEAPPLSQMLQEKITEGLPEQYREGAQDIADIEEFLLPFVPKGGKGVKAKGAVKAPKGQIHSMIAEREAMANAPTQAEKWVPETFESGLTKPGAVGAKNPRFATISKARQEETLQKLETEAQSLFKKKVAERMPITEKIKEGFDFDAYHKKEFGDLLNLAKKANPEIDVTPLSKFLSEESGKLRGIRSPSPDKLKIKNEISKFSRNPVNSLYELLKNRRNYSQKLTGIYEQRLMKGKQQEYVDFLNRLNRKIDESIGQTLPEDSQWFNKYKRLNREFADYKRGQEVIKTLEPILREKMSTSALTRLAENPDKQKYLRIKMGDEASEEIIQIAKDLKTAQGAIKKLTVKDFNKLDTLWPLTWAFKPAGAVMTAKKGLDYARKGYGYVLTSSSKRKAFDEMLHAVTENNVPAYEKAVEKLE